MLESNITKRFLEDQNGIRRFSIRFMVSVFFVVFAVISAYFYYSAVKTFEDENEKIKSEYIELQKNLLKTRVDQAYNFIESIRRSSDAKLQETVKSRVQEAYNAANFIYDKYKNKESESAIKQRIIDALEKMKYDGGKSYVWITDYNNNAVTYPGDPSMVGKYIGGVQDLNGNYTVKKQSEHAKKYKEGYLKDYYSKKGEDGKKRFEQITYVKDFGHFDWYFGSAIFLDEHTKKVQNEVLDALAMLRFDNNYIFVDTQDGYALLMNGKKLSKPEYIADITDKNGVKVIKEQLKAAKLSKSGGYVEYIWHEAQLNKDMPHLSFCKMVDDWGWKIGTGLYVGKINDEIERRKESFKQKIIGDTLVLVGLLVLLAVIVLFIAFAVDKKITKLFEAMNSKIDSHSQELLELNRTLEYRVEKESSRRVEQEAFVIQQSKMAMMGEMIDTIAHQWKQPLSALMIMTDELCLQKEAGELSIEELREFAKESKTHIRFMGQTIDDFRGFMKPSEQKEDVEISSLVHWVETIYAKQLKNENIELEQKIEQKISVKGYKNELSQALLSIVSNAKDALKTKKSGGKISIRAFRDGSAVVLEIEDNGGGIDESVLPSRLFEHRVSTKGENGSGVGLWLCALIVKKHGGDIRAYNKNEGAVFEIILPAE